MAGRQAGRQANDFVCNVQYAVSGFVCVYVMYELQNGINGCNRIRQPKNAELQQRIEKHWIASILVMVHTTCLSFLVHATHIYT